MAWLSIKTVYHILLSEQKQPKSLGQYDSSLGNRAHCNAELAVSSSLAIAIAIASPHMDGQAELT